MIKFKDLENKRACETIICKSYFPFHSKLQNTVEVTMKMKINTCTIMKLNLILLCLKSPFIKQPVYAFMGGQRFLNSNIILQ